MKVKSHLQIKTLLQQSGAIGGHEIGYVDLG